MDWFWATLLLAAGTLVFHAASDTLRTPSIFFKILYGVVAIVGTLLAAIILSLWMRI